MFNGPNTMYESYSFPEKQKYNAKKKLLGIQAEVEPGTLSSVNED
jgi:hypothetical protein